MRVRGCSFTGSDRKREKAEGLAGEWGTKNPSPDPLFLPLPAHKGLEVKWVG